MLFGCWVGFIGWWEREELERRKEVRDWCCFIFYLFGFMVGLV